MTACYLYALVRDPASIPPPGMMLGLRDMPLELVVINDIAAVISQWQQTRAESPSATDANDVWRHEQVIEACMAFAPTLPVRFGTLLATPARVREVLVQREPQVVSALAHVANRVEMGLRVLWTPSTVCTWLPDAVRHGGADYLHARAAQWTAEREMRAVGESLACHVHEALCPMSVDSSFQILLTKHLLLSSAYLIERDVVDVFRAEIKILRHAYADLAFMSSGPWPPYHFTGAIETWQAR